MKDPFGVSKGVNPKKAATAAEMYRRRINYIPPFKPGNKRATSQWNDYVAADKEHYLKTGKLLPKGKRKLP